MPSWISKNDYLTIAEMQNNALCVWGYFNSIGWSINAVAAMLGNMQSESSINPGIWENLEPFAGGYGLVQWTPYTNYSNWAGTNWQNNGTRQCERIEWEFANGEQYYQTSAYPIPPEDFKVSTEDAGTLAVAFLYNYERPLDPAATENDRRINGRYWYSFLSGEEPPDPPTPGGSIPYWLLFKFQRKRKLARKGGRKWKTL